MCARKNRMYRVNSVISVILFCKNIQTFCNRKRLSICLFHKTQHYLLLIIHTSLRRSKKCYYGYHRVSQSSELFHTQNKMIILMRFSNGHRGPQTVLGKVTFKSHRLFNSIDRFWNIFYS